MTTKSCRREWDRSGRLSPRRSVRRPGLVAAIGTSKTRPEGRRPSFGAVNRDWGRIAVFAGGFLGPFGGGVVTVLVPDLRTELHTSTAGAAAPPAGYPIPLALLPLFSGTIRGRRGPAATSRRAVVVSPRAAGRVA